MREGAHYRTYKSWQALKDRCNRAKCINYNKYGGAGVTYDPSWEKYDQFKLLGWDVERAVTTGKVG